MSTTTGNPINTSSSVGSVDMVTRVCCDFNVRSAKVLFMVPEPGRGSIYWVSGCKAQEQMVVAYVKL